STRSLVEAHHVSPLTVSRAIAELAREGILATRPGAGTFAAEPRKWRQPDQSSYSWQTIALGERPIDTEGLSPLADPPHADGVISLATGYLHGSLMPLASLRSALTRAARLPDSWERPPAFGLHSLRSWFARDAGPGVDAQDVLITSGGQGALSVAFRALVPSGAPLLVESPTYPGAIAAARSVGARPVPVPADGDGVIPELLAEAFARTGARAFFCQPAFHNPTGAVLAAGRRQAVLGIAAAAGAFVVEDDVARALSHDQRPPPPLLSNDRDGRVVSFTSLTKVSSPSLRVGAMIARGPVADRLRSLRVIDELFVSRPLQETALDLISRPAWDRHLKELSRSLNRRAAALAGAVERHLPAVEITPPAGGMHLWARLPKDLDDTEVAQAARLHGVIVMPGRPFFPAEPPGPRLRLTFSGAAAEADLELGIRRLARAAPRLTG
ncbi:MAG TPA: PLP-dependent aminotransferase family protein, partial [Streptosporangiaceae bacterium]|nr:PLP-dependent aminotransferase family protein [Streptosporangiaceae bacterium]